MYVSSDIGATIARSALSLDHGMDWLKLQVKLLVRAQRVTGAANLLEKIIISKFDDKSISMFVVSGVGRNGFQL